MCWLYKKLEDREGIETEEKEAFKIDIESKESSLAKLTSEESIAWQAAQFQKSTKKSETGNIIYFNKYNQ